MSEELDIVKSDKWANLQKENGIDGAPVGMKHSYETKKKMSKPRSEEGKRNMRKPRSEEAKKRMSEGQKGKLGPNRGKKFDDEWVKNLSKSHIGNEPGNKGKIGYFNHSNETKKKMSESHKGKMPWNKGKSGLKYNKLKGNNNV
jgi:hypothetical protein